MWARYRILAAAGLAAATATLCGACKKHAAKEQPAPSASVLSLGVEIAACDDIAFCEKRCDEGKGDDCRRLGVSFQLGKGTSKDETRATAFFEKGCALGNPLSCVSSGQMYEFEHGVTRDLSKAAAYYEKACSAGYAPGCYNFGIMLENGRGVRRDVWKAIANYDIACRAGAATACARVKELGQGADAGAP
jgi:TPR repeat protein